MYNGRRCRESLKLKPSPANLKRASLHRAAIIDAINRGVFDYSYTFPNSKNIQQDPSSQLSTIKDYLDSWLKSQKHIVKSSTFYSYKKIVNGQLIPAFGNLAIDEIKRFHVREWCESQNASNKTIANKLSPLRIALQQAADDELIKVNPLYGWHYRKNEPPKHDKIDPFTREEQAAILAALSGQSKNLIQFAFWSGLRTSEYIALNWGDIDFNRGVIVVSKALTQAANSEETTKTKAGKREVKLLSPALEAIRAQKQHTFIKGDEVFQNPRTLERWDGDAPIRKTLWVRALKKAGVRYRNPYQTRHTFASMLLSTGENPLAVAKQMGHSSVKTIFNNYGRWMDAGVNDIGDQAVNRFFK